MKPRASASPPPEPFRGSFVGRDHDIDVIERTVAAGARLVTLLGPGGVGKTRLLHGVGRKLAARYASVIWCDLSSARSAGDVVTRVAAATSGIALGAAATSDAAVERVGRALARRGTCLLELDNLEQLEASALPLLAHWLGDAPKLVVLATSRVRLGVAGEVIHRVEPLSLAADAEHGVSEAMRLFEDRVRAVRGAFSPAERSAAERIVALLEGMPLALEMAATRLCVLRPEELFERLSRPLALLIGSRIDPDRHASLSRVLDGSWELLVDEERRILAELGVFVGGFTIESAEAVVAGDTLGVLQRLVDSSLLRPVPSRTRRARHAPYEVVREYALERLVDERRLDEVRLRHARHFASWGEARLTRIKELDADASRAALQELVDDEANLAAAAAYLRSVDSDDGHSLVLRVLTALEPVRMLRGQLDPWVLDLDAALSAVGASSVPVVAHARLALAHGLHELGRSEPARAAYELAISASSAARDATLESLARSGLGRLVAGLGEWDLARALFEKARTLPGAGEAAQKLATACFEFYGSEGGTPKDVAGAVAAYIAVCRRGSDPRELVLWIVQLGRTESEIRRLPDAAEVHLDEGLQLARRLGDIRGEGFALFGLGAHQLGFGRADDAVGTLDDAARLLGEAGTKRYEGWAIGFIGVAHAVCERWPSALDALDRSIERLASVGDTPREAHQRAFRAAVHARLDREKDAMADLERASQLAPPSSGYHGWTIELCRGQLDVMRAREALQRGAAADAREHLDIARALLRRARWPRGGCREAREWPWAGEYYEPRLAAELLDHAIDAIESPEGVLRIAEDGSFFVLPSGERASCLRREKLQRILVRLANERIARAGCPVPPAELIEEGWPGERIQSSAASNRLHVALDALRKLGLRGLIVRGEGGWLLDPAVPCATVAPSEN